MAKRTRTEIVIDERLKIVRIDSLNWQVYERRAIKDNHSTSRAGEVDWVAMPAFFRRVEHAVEWVARKRFADCGEVFESLEDAVKAIRASNRKLARDVSKALEGATA